MDYAKIRELGASVPKLVNLTCKVPKAEYEKIFRISTRTKLNMGETVRALVLYAIHMLESEDSAEEVSE